MRIKQRTLIKINPVEFDCGNLDYLYRWALCLGDFRKFSGRK